ncbi:MAG: glycosyltransferase [Chitinophagaceae bacterium]|nr:glycosyltransferase [Chitinophagaceae bacterium]
MANVLSVVWYKVLPAKFGGQKGIACFNEFLSAHHNIVCTCSCNNQPSGKEPYKVLPVLPASRTQVINPFAWRKIISIAKKENCSHVIIEHCYYGLLGIFLKHFYSKKLIVHSHNIEYLRFRTIGKWWWFILRLLEKRTHRAADLNLFKTKEDLDYAAAYFGLNPSACIVVPYGLMLSAVPSPEKKTAARLIVSRQHHIQQAAKIILFNGTLDYEPNANAVRLIVNTLVPLLLQKNNTAFKVIVCGRNIYSGFEDLQQLKHECYINAGLVEDIEPYFLAADVFINPVLEGGGIKVKVMEALAYNVPVVSTESGARGISLQLAGEKLKLVKDGDWEEFCRQIILQSDNRTDTPEDFFNQYHWSEIIKPVAERINELK